MTPMVPLTHCIWNVCQASPIVWEIEVQSDKVWGKVWWHTIRPFTNLTKATPTGAHILYYVLLVIVSGHLQNNS